MPDVSFVLTNSFKAAWGNYWSKRPNDEPLDMIETLRNSVVVESVDGFKAKDGTTLWAHPQMPEHAFAVVPIRNVEHMVVTILRAKKPKVRIVERVVVDVPATKFDQVPDIGSEPAGTPKERWAWAKAACESVSKWLSQNDKSAPCYRQMVDLNNRLMKRQKGLRLEVEAEAEKQMESDVHGELFEVNGRVVCIPAIRWLLREVKELRAKLAAIEQQHGA